jgi:hypothetical protein
MKNFILIALLLLASTAFAADTKDADLAGSWYPASKTELHDMLQGYLDKANPAKVDGQIFAIISPHAGYQFSGPVAAYGFKLAESPNIKTVIVIGFSHRSHYDGISVYAKGNWRTPLGEVPIDERLAAKLVSSNSRIRFEPSVFREENSVEMQIPFVQTVFRDAEILPIAFGTQNYGDAELLAQALADALKERQDCLIVASTDLSHYHPYEEANSIDKRLIATLETMKARALFDEANVGLCELCGLMPVTATLLAAEKLGFNKIKILKYANSGDATGDRGRVVGYLSAMVYKAGGRGPVTGARDEEKENKQEGAAMLNDAQRKRLLQIARESITSYVKDGKRKTFTEKDPLLNESLGAFVTLHETGELRGCIGNMVGQGPLYQTIADMSVESATGDPRFPRLSAKEIPNIVIEISVLSPMNRISGHEEIKIPGHGVLVRKGFASGVYLPQVADETGWNKEEFMSSLCAHKAGLPPDAWKDKSTELYVFTAEVFGENQK